MASALAPTSRFLLCLSPVPSSFDEKLTCKCKGHKCLPTQVALVMVFHLSYRDPTKDTEHWGQF